VLSCPSTVKIMVEMSLTHVQFDQRWIKHANTFEVLYRMSEKFLSLISCMTGKVVMDHVLLEYHIKVKKYGGAFKVIPVILMHYYSDWLYANQDCKHDLQKYSKMKNLMSSWKCNKSITLRNSWKRTRKWYSHNFVWLGQMNKVLVMKGSSFTSVKNSFEIMAIKFVPYFEGEKD